MGSDAVIDVFELGSPPWPTRDPFLFCVHHLDNYPAGNEQMGPPRESLVGRNIGMDFSGRDGWSMYHGDVVPGFPAHPHRGFETITIARNGYIDHSDSLGATARFGHGDVQWMTAGGGIVHSEMFPLVERDAPNPTELFQIWLNLPREQKMEEPYFTMLWSESVPQETFEDVEGCTTTVRIVAGALGELTPPPPPPSSWASREASDVAVWTIEMDPGAEWTLPGTGSPDANRVLYFFVGETLTIDGRGVPVGRGIQVRASADVTVKNGDAATELLMLQGRPIGEPVAQHGPFVMTTQAEIRQAMLDYRRTQYGGWPWKTATPVHPREEGRFAIHADGREERPGG